jgi:LmbE family N-acetylglucosaminyl deacetylase
MTLRFLAGSLCLLVGSFPLVGQRNDNPPPDARFKADLLLVVAHPDDETQIGAYLPRAIFDEHKRVAVVFGTKGNGGGNAEGQEQAASLGALREIEAREAVAHFGISHVWFLNGLDTPGQGVLDSLETWGHGDSLQRLIRLVRITRPSVIVTWLPDWVAGENHGDHQAAGVIATEAFDMAGDPTVFPEQLSAPKNRYDTGNLTEGLHPWQAQKLYYVSDRSDQKIFEGKGPVYSATDVSASRRVPYANLAAEECAFHLTQGDTGQMAREALAKNDLHYFQKPVHFIFGKSYVDPSVTADLFQGVKSSELVYRKAPGFDPPAEGKLKVELGASWRFYHQFWQAHGLDHLSTLVGPEIQARPKSFLVIPVVAENTSDQSVDVAFTVDLPEGFSFRRPIPANASVPPHRTATFPLEVTTASTPSSGSKTINISSKTNGGTPSQIAVQVEVNSGAMPE